MGVSELTVALIGAGSAIGGTVVGGTLTGVLQFQLEKRRATYAMKQTEAVAIHQGQLNHDEFERHRLAGLEETQLARRGAARMLNDQLARAAVHCLFAAHNGHWWLDDPAPPPPLDNEHRLILAAGVDDWMAVNAAELLIADAEAVRLMRLSEAPGSSPLARPLTKTELTQMKLVLDAVESARSALFPLAK